MANVTWSHSGTRKGGTNLSVVAIRRRRTEVIEEDTPAYTAKSPVFNRNRLTGKVTHYPNLL